MVSLAWDLPYTYSPQLLIVALLLMGVALTEDNVGTTLAGAVIVNG